MKDKLGGKMMRKFSALTAKTYSYLTDNSDKDKKNKKPKKVCHKAKT